MLTDFKRKVVAFTIENFSGSEVRVDDASTIAENMLAGEIIFADATWIQGILEHAKNTQDPLMGNAMTLLRVIESEAKRTLESQLEIFEERTKKIQKVLKKINYKKLYLQIKVSLPLSIIINCFGICIILMVFMLHLRILKCK